MTSSGKRRVALLFASCLILVALAGLCVTAASPTRHGWPGCPAGAMQSSGYIDIPGVGNTKKHYFYWLFAPRHYPTDGSEPPVIMWMTGGPGCSSNFALMTELGPCLMNESSGELYYNPYGWNDNAYLLFVDQTAGVGYSYADKINWDHNESEAAEDMYNFLQGFAKKFTTPSITGKNDFYVIGESYGGHYVPSVGYRILQGNLNGDGPHINLKGVAVGNGMTDPYTQYPAYGEFASTWCQQRYGEPCITAEAKAEMDAVLPACLDAIARCNIGSIENEACDEAYDKCIPYAYDWFKPTGLNHYDVRKPCIGDGCYPEEQTDSFLNRSDVRAALGVPPAQPWYACNDDAGELFHRDYHRNFNWTVPPMLANGIEVIIFAGDADYICNWIGNKRWVLELEWPGKAGFNAAQDEEFAVNGQWAGKERRYGNFRFVQIYDAGHMVPMDQPEVALHLVHRLLQGESLR